MNTGSTGDTGGAEGTGKGPPRKRLSKSTRQGMEAYQGALEAVLAIAIGAGLGFWADPSDESGGGGSGRS
jgi:hypothetical protein